MNFLLQKLESLLLFRLSVGKDFVILSCIILIQRQHVTDRQTDILIVANTGLCISSYADAL